MATVGLLYPVGTVVSLTYTMADMPMQYLKYTPTMGPNAGKQLSGWQASYEMKNQERRDGALQIMRERPEMKLDLQQAEDYWDVRESNKRLDRIVY